MNKVDDCIVSIWKEPDWTSNDIIKYIKPFYYSDYNNYSNLLINIDRISENENTFKKLINFPYCQDMPQHNDPDEKIKKFNRDMANQRLRTLHPRCGPTRRASGS